MNDIAKNIIFLRERAKLTQYELADKLCVSRQTVSAWERGRTRPAVDFLETLAQALSCDVSEIIAGHVKMDTELFVELAYQYESDFYKAGMNLLNDHDLYEKAIISTLLEMFKRLNDLTIDNYKPIFLEALAEKCHALNSKKDRKVEPK